MLLPPRISPLTAAAYLVEIWPYSQRTRGLGVMQIWGKLAGFFSTNVNPLALTAIDWKYFAIYCGWIFFELSFIFWFYPETYKRTLEELAFREYLPLSFASEADANGRSVRGQGLQRTGHGCRGEAACRWACGGNAGEDDDRGAWQVCCLGSGLGVCIEGLLPFAQRCRVLLVGSGNVWTCDLVTWSCSIDVICRLRPIHDHRFIMLTGVDFAF